ncbi:hypothetical protein KP509_27G044800 [Ceratopteris richardii]|uniref:Uncharacterized protein n=1 Tax=Ceratopteris richardii TaxID=49495 RepID=A0A8T2RHF4_CERRI|nr:hypothetical protein KP509_27G044800 [Ceratopteris richardii]
MSRSRFLPLAVLLSVLVIYWSGAPFVAAAAGAWPGYASGTYVDAYSAAAGAAYQSAGKISDVEDTRRSLATTTTYISYAALSANSVPCSTAGVSYYSCASSGAVNPYTRSCTTITLCARDTS